MKIVVFGLSVTSTWGNGHGTTYRALLRALHERGHDIVFFEKDVEWYASNRDLPDPSFCRVKLYENWNAILPQVRRELNGADVAMVGSYFPDGIAAIEEMCGSNVRVKAFYDIDTPITLRELRERGTTDYLRAAQIANLDIYFSFTGGPALREIEERFHAGRAVPLYCSVEPEEHRRTQTIKKFACDLSYMGTYAPDRQPKIDELLCDPARQLPEKRFLVAGPQYPRQVRWPKNVRRRNHLNPRWHASFYSSSRFTLNVTRRDMVIAGYSPSVRLFEAAACGAAMISDNWPGLDNFFASGEEILLPTSASDVARYLTELTEEEVRRIGENAQARVLAEHTSRLRALEFERAVESRSPRQSLTECASAQS
ncbi:MAG: glycosyltransferase [Candidatus Korobacteraceae bacterium]